MNSQTFSQIHVRLQPSNSRLSNVCQPISPLASKV